MAPPYDIITPDYKETLYKKSPYNIVRIDYGKDFPGDDEKENRYSRGANYLSDWINNRILILDDRPAFYYYEILYRIKGLEKTLKGFLGIVKLEEFGKGSIHPHEMTRSKPKEDRLNIMRYCQSNISPIFALYNGSEQPVSSFISNHCEDKPIIEAVDRDGFLHRLWAVYDESSIKTIADIMSSKEIFIADGHHRYETALDYKRELEDETASVTGDEPFRYVMMFLSDLDEAGYTLLPTHRVISGSLNHILERLFAYCKIESTNLNHLSDESAVEQLLFMMENRDSSLGLYLKEDSFHLLEFNESLETLNVSPVLRNLTVTKLHKVIFDELIQAEEIKFEMDPFQAVNMVKNSRNGAAFFLNPTKISEVKEVVRAHERMPPKSTYFYPKLLTGMVFYPLSGSI